MVSVLDIVIESVKVLIFTAEGEVLKKFSEVTIAQITAEAGLLISVKVKFLEDAGEFLMLEKECCVEEFEFSVSGVFIKELEFIV